jgi:hypothetical protein
MVNACVLSGKEAGYQVNEKKILNTQVKECTCVEAHLKDYSVSCTISHRRTLFVTHTLFCRKVIADKRYLLELCAWFDY